MAPKLKSAAGKYAAKEMKKFVNFAKALDKINEEWLQKLGDEVLREAQNLVPVGSGHLKESHKVEYTKDGFKIIADTPYAHALHEGAAKQKLTGRWKSDIPKHFRRTANGYFPIRRHTKTYKTGYKPVKLKKGGLFIGRSGDEWATLNVNKKAKKDQWLQEAWRIVRKRQDPATRKLLQKSLYIAP